MTFLDRPNYRKAKNEALGILRTFSILEPPVNPVELARELDTQVFFVEFQPDMDNISGFFYAKDNSIYVNKKESALRQTFTVAHELGHKVMHLEWANSSQYQVLLRNQSGDAADPKELEANAFAANLLVPRFMLDDFYPLASIPELSKIFAVSVPVIKNRINSEYGE